MPHRRVVTLLSRLHSTVVPQYCEVPRYCEGVRATDHSRKTCVFFKATVYDSRKGDKGGEKRRGTVPVFIQYTSQFG